MDICKDTSILAKRPSIWNSWPVLYKHVSARVLFCSSCNNKSEQPVDKISANSTRGTLVQVGRAPPIKQVRYIRSMLVSVYHEPQTRQIACYG